MNVAFDVEKDPSKSIAIYPKLVSIHKTSLYHKSKRSGRPTKAMVGSRGIVYELAKANSGLTRRALARRLEIDEHSSLTYCRELTDVFVLSKETSKKGSQIETRYSLTLPGKIVALALDSEERQPTGIDRLSLSLAILDEMRFDPDNLQLDFGWRLLSLFLEAKREDMILQWARYTARICLGEYAKDYIATSWVFLPEYLYYHQKRTFFIAVDWLLPQLRKGQISMVISWLDQIFEKNPQFYQRLTTDEKLARIQKALEAWKSFEDPTKK